MNTLTILSHNVYWFQGDSFAGDLPGPPQPAILTGLADMYRQVGADLLCLQEVQSMEAFRAISERLGMNGSHLPGGDLPHYGVASLWRAGRDASPRERRIRPQRMWQIVRVFDGSGRPPIEARACGELTVCNIHLPSSRQLGNERAAHQRVAELAEAISVAPRPAVVLGDFNEPPGGPVHRLLVREGYLDAAVLAGQAALPTTQGSGRIDVIWIRADLCGRLMEYGLSDSGRMATNLPDKRRLSDHCALWVRLSAGSNQP